MTTFNLSTKQGRYLARKAGLDVPRRKQGAIASDFWSCVQKTDSCWLWTRSKRHDGYGQRSFRGKPDGAHRVAWMMTYGEIPDGQCVLHRCDVRTCVNPDHLFLGTNDENMADMVRKGRQPFGTKNPMAKLNPSAVLTIRQRLSVGDPVAVVAHDYHVHISAIYAVRSG